ncbi:MAG TPA: hypothetical protein VMB21_11370 [Candidatus Limnocylindria bacterium]|nr:hypothetical protein [Candidatus Limnocylindria bacterium]
MPPSAAPPPFRWRRFWLGAIAVLVLSPFVLVGALALVVWSSLHVGSDVAALRRSVMPSTAGWHKQVEVSVGWFPLLLAKAGLHFAPLPPEARIALRAARSGEVVVYERSSPGALPDQGDLLLKADETMRRRGWDRTVGVVDHDDLVAVYTPAGLDSARRMKACVLVLNRENFVIVSAAADLRPLMELIHEHPEWQRHLHPASGREVAAEAD